MKKTIGILTLAAAVVLLSCEGEPGPPGQDGVSFLGNVFEVKGDFTSQNNYELFYEFPAGFEMYESDIVLVYILWEVVEGNDGGTVDVWRPLPQSVVLNEGILQYNFDYTFGDVRIFLDGDINFNILLPAEKENQIFRIVVFPADYAKNNLVDVENLDAVMDFLAIDETTVRKIGF